MGLISRVYTFVNGSSADATQVNSEFDTIHTAINGNLDNANIASGAAIAASKLASIPQTGVLDYADSISDYSTTTTPVDTAGVSLPTTLAGEMERLRYRMAALRGYFTNLKYMNASGTATAAAWFEPKIVGRNLLPNPGFEQQSGAANSAPDGWTLYSTPDAVAIETPASSSITTFGIKKRSLRIHTDGANEGIYTTVGGLKKSTKYLVGLAYTITDNGTVAGTLHLDTAGGVSGVAYQNLALTDGTQSDPTVAFFNGIVLTDSSATDLVVRIYNTTAGGDFNLVSAWMYELSDGIPDELPAIPQKVADYTTANDTVTNTGAGAWTTRSGLSLSQYVPCAGYRLIYDVSISYMSESVAASVRDFVYAFRIQADSGSGAATVEGPYSCYGNAQTNNEIYGGTFRIQYVLDNPTPGLTYAMTTDVYIEGTGGNTANTIIFNPAIGAGSLATVSRARLRLERM